MGAVVVSHESQRLGDNLLLFRVEVLELVVLGAYDGEGDGDQVHVVLVRMVSTVSSQTFRNQQVSITGRRGVTFLLIVPTLYISTFL